MKTRILVHIALNAKNERVGCLVVACGQLIPLTYCDKSDLNRFKSRADSMWLALDWSVESSLEEWKKSQREYELAVRFQRVILEGEAV